MPSTFFFAHYMWQCLLFLQSSPSLVFRVFQSIQKYPGWTTEVRNSIHCAYPMDMFLVCFMCFLRRDVTQLNFSDPLGNSFPLVPSMRWRLENGWGTGNCGLDSSLSRQSLLPCPFFWALGKLARVFSGGSAGGMWEEEHKRITKGCQLIMNKSYFVYSQEIWAHGQ